MAPLISPFLDCEETLSGGELNCSLFRVMVARNETLGKQWVSPITLSPDTFSLFAYNSCLFPSLNGVGWVFFFACTGLALVWLDVENAQNVDKRVQNIWNLEGMCGNSRE